MTSKFGYGDPPELKPAIQTKNNGLQPYFKGGDFHKEGSKIYKHENAGGGTTAKTERGDAKWRLLRFYKAKLETQFN